MYEYTCLGDISDAIMVPIDVFEFSQVPKQSHRVMIDEIDTRDSMNSLEEPSAWAISTKLGGEENIVRT